MNDIATMTPQKRERYAQWLRTSGVEHPSDELINQTQKRALLQIANAKDKVLRRNVKLIAIIFCCLVVTVCIWFKL